MKLKGITSAILSCGIIASMAGVVSGTLAWYQYSTRVNASYTGVAVNSVSNLQIGFKSTLDLSDIPGLTQDTMGTSSYWFAGDGQGLTYEQINAYLSKTEYANNALYPVTSSVYTRDSNDSLHLLDAISYGVNDPSYPMDKAFVKLPLAFRISLRNKGVFQKYTPWKNVWINKAETALEQNQGTCQVQNGLRVFVDGDLYGVGDTEKTPTRYIFNPSDKSSAAGSTTIGGLLDLNNDGFYDFSGKPGVEGSKEIIYGVSSGQGTTTWNIHDQPYAEPDPSVPGDIGQNYQNPEIPDTFVDINGTGSTEHSTFTAAHCRYIDHYDNYDGITFGKADYETLSTIAGSVDEDTGKRSGGKPVCTTNEDCVGNVMLTIYLEGWDHSIIDLGINKLFKMNLGFEIGTA